MTTNESKKPKNDNPGNSIVKIYFGNTTYDIHRGRRTVVEIKAVLGIEDEYILIFIVDGELINQDQDGSIVIKGNEQFGSQPPDGASS